MALRERIKIEIGVWDTTTKSIDTIATVGRGRELTLKLERDETRTRGELISVTKFSSHDFSDTY